MEEDIAQMTPESLAWYAKLIDLVRGSRIAQIYYYVGHQQWAELEAYLDANPNPVPPACGGAGSDGDGGRP